MIRKIGTVTLVALVLAGIGNSKLVHRAYAAAPTAELVVSNTSLSLENNAALTITFSEPVNGLDAADLKVPGGSLSNMNSPDGGRTWIFTLTPTPGFQASHQVVTLDNTGVTDRSSPGIPGAGTTLSNEFWVDTVRPSLARSIEISDTSLKIGDSAAVTFVFNEAVTGFTAANLTVSNGVLSGLSSSDGGITWTATLTPASSVRDVSNVLTLNYSGIGDAAGNAGTGTVDSSNYVVDTVRPTAEITVSETSLKAGDTATVTFAFSEAVQGFTAADVSLQNGTLSGLSSNDGALTWTATLTPNAGIEALGSKVTLDNTGFANLSGNPGLGTTESNAYDIDTKRPDGKISLTNNTLRAGTTSEVSITFSEAVTGFANKDLAVANGTLSDVTSSDGGITWTATLTPDANVSSPLNVIVLDKSGVVDLAGNIGTGTASSDPYAVRTVVPTSVVTVENSKLTAGGTAKVEIVFSEAVTGFDNDDLTVENGTLSRISSADGGTVWTALLTPKADVNAPVNRITLRNEGVVSAAGNAGIGLTSSNAYAVLTTGSNGGGSSAPSVPPTPMPTPSPAPVPSDDLPVSFLPAVDGPVVSTNGVLTLPAGQSGTVSLGEAVRIEIPAGAASQTFKLTVDRVADTRNLLTKGEILASPVFELRKSFPENFNKPVRLTFGFDPAALTGGRTAGLFYYDDTRKEWIETQNADIQGNRISAEVDHFMKYAVLAVNKQAEEAAGGNPQPIVLRDMSGHWAEKTVGRAVSAGIVSGYPDGTFKPNADVTRAEFAVMLIHVLGEEAAGPALGFTDTSEIGAWAQNAVTQAAAAGILNGYSDGSFRPNAEITRAEMAVMTARAFRLVSDDSAGASFADDRSIPVWAQKAAAALKSAGVVQGNGANAFRPNARATRAEAAVILMNAVDRSASH